MHFYVFMLFSSIFLFKPFNGRQLLGPSSDLSNLYCVLVTKVSRVHDIHHVMHCHYISIAFVIQFLLSLQKKPIAATKNNHLPLDIDLLSSLI